MITLANPAAAFAAGAQYAQQIRAAKQQNALLDLYQSQGAGIASGEQGAINALAALDPNAAMGARQNALSAEAAQLGMAATRQSMAFKDEEMDMLRNEAKAAAAAEAAKMSEQERAAEIAQMENVLSGAAALIDDRPQFEAFLQSQGMDPAQIPPGMERAFIAMTEGGRDALKEIGPSQPEWAAAAPEIAAQYGAAAGQINNQTGEFKPINPPSGMSITTNPDGTMALVQGPGAGGKPLTEAEGKNSGFLIRMKAASDVLDQFEGQGLDLMASLKAKDPTGLLNYTQSPEFQQYEQAKRDFINAILRRESGAAIAASEFANAEQQYFPVPGDKPEVVEQKRRAREKAVAGVAVGSGQGLNNAVVKGADGIAAGNDFAKMSAAELGALDIRALTDQQKEAVSARLTELGF